MLSCGWASPEATSKFLLIQNVATSICIPDTRLSLKNADGLLFVGPGIKDPVRCFLVTG